MPSLSSLLLNALAQEDTCYVLGAGASAPDVPTMGQLYERVGSYAGGLSSFPVGTSLHLDTPLLSIVAPMIARARSTSSLDEWKAGAMTPGAISCALEALMTEAHWKTLPQYLVFGILPFSAWIINFNWDGLAHVRCPQPSVHPHGRVIPHFLSPEAVLKKIDLAQDWDFDARRFILPGVVMPGEEEGPNLAKMREWVFDHWRKAGQIVVIGYRFGLGSDLAYDRVWLDSFVEAFRVNSGAAIHLIDPAADWIRGELVERLGRTINVYAWPYRWDVLSSTLLARARVARVHGIGELRVPQPELIRAYQEMEERIELRSQPGSRAVSGLPKDFVSTATESIL